MPYVTSVERIAEARGKARWCQPLATAACQGLWTSPEDVTNCIRSLPFQQIEALSEALLDFRSLADLQNWLDPNDDPAE